MLLVGLVFLSVVDVEDFFPLIMYRLNPRERQQCTQLLERLEAARAKLDGQQPPTDDDLYLPMEPGNVGPGYATLEPSGKASGYTEVNVEHPEESDMYSYADPDQLKRPIIGQNPKGEYVGLGRRDDEEKDGDGEQKTTDGQSGYINVVKDNDCLEVKEEGRKESRDDGYIDFLSGDKGQTKAKKTKKGKKEQKRKASKGTIDDDDAGGEAGEGEATREDVDESRVRPGKLLFRMGAKVKGTLTGLSSRRGQQGQQSPTIRRKREDTKLIVNMSDLVNPEYEGMLQRRKHGISRGWEGEVWYILHSHTLYHCRSKDDEYATKDFPVFAYSIKPFVNKQQDPAFELSHPGVSTEVYKAETIDKRDEWIGALTAATQIEGLESQQPDVHDKPYGAEPENSEFVEDDVYENADDEPPQKNKDEMHPEQATEELDVYENPDTPIAPKPPSVRRKVSISASRSASQEMTYENVDIELYEDVEEEQYVYRAIKSHKAADDDEISFASGDLVLMDNMDDRNWWVGTIQNKITREFSGERGFVPKAYFVLKASS